jgi:hypothetical protein
VSLVIDEMTIKKEEEEEEEVMK